MTPILITVVDVQYRDDAWSFEKPAQQLLARHLVVNRDIRKYRRQGANPERRMVGDSYVMPTIHCSGQSHVAARLAGDLVAETL